VSPQIEVMAGVRSWRVELAADRSTVGKAAENDIAVDDDATASGLHAVLERFAAGWCVTDLGSSNGTWVNGERIWATRRLRNGDEIRIGQTRLVFCDPLRPAGAATEVEQAPPR
jgi:pSer/pThr/pTyr-binding forkhead associated (FHA) protein